MRQWNSFERQLSVDEKSHMYLFFAHLFYGNHEIVKDTITEVDNISLESTAINEIIRKLKFLPIKDLKIQYENLFLIPGVYYVPPYAAYYLYDVQEDVASRELIDRLAEVYEREGFLEYAKSLFLRFDHLGTMFMFIHFMLLKMETGVESSSIVRKTVFTFIETNINSWFGEFEKNVSSILKYGFYLEFVQYIHQFIDMESTDYI